MTALATEVGRIEFLIYLLFLSLSQILIREIKLVIVFPVFSACCGNALSCLLHDSLEVRITI